MASSTRSFAVVDKRYADGRFDPVRTIAAFGDKIRAAAGESSNYELVVKQAKLGGNGPHHGQCSRQPGTWHDLYRQSWIIPTFIPYSTTSRGSPRSSASRRRATPTRWNSTTAKIMLGKQETLHEVNWENLQSRVGGEKLAGLIGGSRLVGMVNWTMLPGMSRIWERLLVDVLPHIKGRPTVFADLADPEKRTSEDIRAAPRSLDAVSRSNVDVILGLNLKEAMQVAAVLQLPSRGDPEATIAEEAAAIRDRPEYRLRGDPPEDGRRRRPRRKSRPTSPGLSSSSRPSAREPATISTRASASGESSAWASKRASAPAWRRAGSTCDRPRVPLWPSWPSSSPNCRRRRGKGGDQERSGRRDFFQTSNQSRSRKSSIVKPASWTIPRHRDRIDRIVAWED